MDLLRAQLIWDRDSTSWMVEDMLRFFDSYILCSQVKGKSLKIQRPFSCIRASLLHHWLFDLRVVRVYFNLWSVCVWNLVTSGKRKNHLSPGNLFLHVYWSPVTFKHKNQHSMIGQLHMVAKCEKRNHLIKARTPPHLQTASCIPYHRPSLCCRV